MLSTFVAKLLSAALASLREYATSAAVTGEPSVKAIPSRSVTVTVVPETVTLCAIP